MATERKALAISIICKYSMYEYSIHMGASMKRSLKKTSRLSMAIPVKCNPWLFCPWYVHPSFVLQVWFIYPWTLHPYSSPPFLNDRLLLFITKQKAGICALDRASFNPNWFGILWIRRPKRSGFDCFFFRCCQYILFKVLYFRFHQVKLNKKAISLVTGKIWQLAP